MTGPESGMRPDRGRLETSSVSRVIDSALVPGSTPWPRLKM